MTAAADSAIVPSVLAHACTRPGEVVPEAWIERLVALNLAEQLAAVADRNRIAGLLWAALSADQRSLLPDEPRSVLQETHLVNALRWQAFRKLLTASARKLAAAGIPVAALKGAALLSSVYRDPGQRTMADLDLLVPEESLADAHELLSEGAKGLAERHPDRHLQTIYLTGEAGRLEVHGTAAHYARWPHAGEIFDTGRSVPLDGAAVIIPDDVSLWLHLACHGLSHDQAHWLRMAADLARLQALPGWGAPQWRAVLHAARETGCTRTALLAASLSTGGDLPAGLREAGASERECAAASERGRLGWGIATGEIGRKFGPWASCWAADGAGRRRELLRHYFPPRDRVMDRLHLPMLLTSMLYPGYVLQRAVKSIGSGLEWRAALRRSSETELLDPP